MSPFAVILPAAGRSTRFGGRNKLAEPLAGLPVIRRTLDAFLLREDVCQIVLPTQDAPGLAELLGQNDSGKLDQRISFCPGGETRAHSVLNGLRAIRADVEWVAVHDAARPMISQGLIDQTLAAAQQHGAAVPAMPVHLTIKQAAGPLPAPVERTIPRQQLWAMQTPQIMRRSSLQRGFDGCPIPLDAVTDDVQLVELAGEEVWLVAGEERNLKITTAIDLRIAELLLEEGR